MIAKMLQSAASAANVRAMTMPQEDINYCINLIRDQDLDRYYISLFAPTEVRADMWALLAFNAEVAKVPSVVSEPMLGEIRVQWWREALESIVAGQPRAHPVVSQLAKHPRFEEVQPCLEEILDAWSQYFEGASDTLKGIESHADKTGGALNVALLRTLQSKSDSMMEGYVRTSGKAWALLGSVRGLPHALVQSGAAQFEAGEGQGASVAVGRDTEQTAKALVPTLKRLVASIEKDLAQLKGERKHKQARVLTALNALSQLYIKEVKRAGYNALQIRDRRPGNVRKLASLFSYHLFG